MRDQKAKTKSPNPRRGNPDAGWLVYLSFSLIRTMTVGSGVSPDLLTSIARALVGSPLGYTTGGEFRPALRLIFKLNCVRLQPGISS